MSRKQKKYHFIYKTTDTRNGNFYIGMHSTDNLNDGYVGSGLRIKNLKYKYGKEIFNIEILEFLPDRESLKKREKEIVDSDLLKEDKCMNLRPGGEGGFISDEQQRHRSLCGGLAMSKKLKNDDEYRKNHSERSSKTMKQNHKDGKMRYDTFKGKRHTEDTKLKMSNTASKRIGEKNSQFGTCWITNGTENKKIKKTDIEYYLKLNWKSGRSSIGNIGKNQYSK